MLPGEVSVQILPDPTYTLIYFLLIAMTGFLPTCSDLDEGQDNLQKREKQAKTAYDNNGPKGDPLRRVPFISP